MVGSITVRDNMEISCTKASKAGIVTIIGQLWQKEDLDTFEDAIDKFIEENIVNIVINMDRLSFINSAGLGLFVRTHKKLTDAKGRVILYSPHSSVLEVLEISGLNSFMVVAKSKDELDKILN